MREPPEPSRIRGVSEPVVLLPEGTQPGRRFVDADGTVWRQKGPRDRELTSDQVHELLLNRQVAVLFTYWDRWFEPIIGGRRETLWIEMEPVLTRAEDPNPDDWTDFGAFEYRTEDRSRKLMIIYKEC